MPSNYRYISPDTKKAVVVLSLTLKPVEIARLVGIHANTVRNIIKLWTTTGQVTRMNAQRGRPRELDNLELAVSSFFLLSHSTSRSPQYIEGLIERRPDIYLSEIQTDFETAFDIWVSERLISRALHRRGYTRKKVWLFTCTP
jgi:transposase